MFDPLAYGEEIASLLALDGDGQRLMPLVRAPASVAGTRERVKKAQLPPVVRAGLYVYFDDWAEAHETAQDIDTVDGSYWHAIVHRQEPDAGNAGYWFRQVGAHPIFPELRTRALELALPVRPALGSERLHRLLRARSRRIGRRAHCAGSTARGVATALRLVHKDWSLKTVSHARPRHSQ